jgi:signal transduction histidine kinase
MRMLDLLARQAADAIERTRAEEKIHQSEKRALALVEELRRMDENKNQFLSILSHELRNPLASIMAYILKFLNYLYSWKEW